jgi:triosephosphate isomerase (TIM)
MHSPPQGWDPDDSPYRSRDGVDVVVFPTSVDIRSCLEKFLVVGAQHGRPEPKGAFTGDISMQILAGHGCTFVLCGHSERRTYHAETDAFVAEQARAAAAAGLIPVVCVGESLSERDAGKAEDVVRRQVSAIDVETVFAYEPVWAIGTGKTASPEDAQRMHAFIRSLLPEARRETTRIVYGGSVKGDNAQALLSQPDIDGALVGSASLDPKSFREIVDAAPLMAL